MRKNSRWVTIAREFRQDGSLSPPELLLPCSVSHNAALECVDGTLHAYGNDLDESGLWWTSARVPSHGPLSALDWAPPVLVVSGLQNVSGCVDRRAAQMRSGACEFDGRVSVVRSHQGGWLLFTRANLSPLGGGRHVSVASSKDGRQWSAFRQISIDKYEDDPSSLHANVYFFAVSRYQEQMVALFPAVSPHLRAGVYMSTSLDGIAWKEPQLLMRSVASGARTPDHPVAGLELSATGPKAAYYLVMHNVSHLQPHILQQFTPEAQSTIVPFVCRYMLPEETLRVAQSSTLGIEREPRSETVAPSPRRRLSADRGHHVNSENAGADTRSHVRRSCTRTVSADENELYILVLMPINPKLAERRRLIRQTWAADAANVTERLHVLSNDLQNRSLDSAGRRHVCIDTRFVVGLPETHKLEGELIEEQLEFHDLIMTPLVQEGSRALLPKVVAAFEWAFHNVPRASYVVKIDDDSYPFWPRLVEAFPCHGLNCGEVSAVVGAAISDFLQPVRSALTNCMGGAFYAISRALLRSLVTSDPLGWPIVGGALLNKHASKNVPTGRYRIPQSLSVWFSAPIDAHEDVFMCWAIEAAVKRAEATSHDDHDNGALTNPFEQVLPSTQEWSPFIHHSGALKGSAEFHRLREVSRRTGFLPRERAASSTPGKDERLWSSEVPLLSSANCTKQATGLVCAV